MYCKGSFSLRGGKELCRAGNKSSGTAQIPEGGGRNDGKRPKFRKNKEK